MAGGFTIKLTGQREMSRKIQAIAKKFPDKAKKALRKRAELIMRDSKENYVPVDKTPLKQSGHVEHEKDLDIALVYGGPAAPYAVAVHEHPSRHSPPSWSKGVTFKVGGPKYLEKPLNKAQQTLAQDLANDLGLEKI